MIDIHCHILPGLDDGAKTLEEAFGIATQLKNVGFDTVIATPHVMEGRDALTPAQIINATHQFNNTLKQYNINLEVLPGAENLIFPDMAHWYREGRLLTLGNTKKYLLVELPMLDIPSYTEQVFFDLQVAGLTPVLAHPERNKALVEEPERLFDWAKRGILFQMNLRSVSGRYGPQAQRYAHSLIQSQLLHFIGSDAHHVSQTHNAYLDELKLLKEHTDPQVFEEVTLSHPQNILKGESIREFTYEAECFNKVFNSEKPSRKLWSKLRKLT